MGADVGDSHDHDEGHMDYDPWLPPEDPPGHLYALGERVRYLSRKEPVPVCWVGYTRRGHARYGVRVPGHDGLVFCPEGHLQRASRERGGEGLDVTCPSCDGQRTQGARGMACDWCGGTGRVPREHGGEG